ncbi:MAG: hypothetical protein ACRDIU_08385, partial [Actinomycetota bacterium]
EMVIPVWAMAALPLSALTSAAVPQAGRFLWAPALAAGMAAAAWRAGASRPAQGPVVGPAGAAVLAASALSAPGLMPWFAYGAGVSGLVVASATRAGGEQTGTKFIFGKARAPVVWAGLVVTAAAWAMSVIMAASGVRAGFLY